MSESEIDRHHRLNADAYAKAAKEEVPKLHPLAKQLVNGARALLELEEEEMITGSDDHERLSSELMETLDKMTAQRINELFPNQ